ncbi:MAG: hypothetical protein ACT4PL_10395 [Phycisphaerales bacterium]
MTPHNPSDVHADAVQSLGLSAAGAARRDAMLADLHSALRSRQRRRILGRSAAAASIALASALTIWFVAAPARTLPQRNGPTLADISPPPDSLTPSLTLIEPAAVVSIFDPGPTRRIVTAIVTDDSERLASLIVTTAGRSRVQRVDDGELVATLRDRGISVGIAHLGNRSFLIEQTRTP